MELNKEIHINQKKTQRIMNENGLKAFQGKSSKFHTYKGDNGNHKENWIVNHFLNNFYKDIFLYLTGDK